MMQGDGGACDAYAAAMKCPWVLCIAMTLTACVSQPQSRPSFVPERFDTPSDGSLAPPRVAHPSQPAATFGDPERSARVVQVLPALDALFSARRKAKKMPGLAVAVVVDGKVVLAKGYGSRDDAGGAVDGDTVFRIGSITKVLTGMALLKLRDEGKLALDDPAAKYVPELGQLIYPTADAAPITLRQLITHDSGLPRLGRFADTDAIAPTEQEVRKSYDGFRLRRAPGLGPDYSNVAVGTLALAIERASGTRYRDYVTNALLRPSAITSAAWDAGDVPPDKLALAHDQNGRGVPASKHWRLGPTEADGGLYLSVSDLAKVITLHLDAWPPRSDPDTGPLRRASLRESHRMKVFGGVRGRLAQEDDDERLRVTANGTGIAWQVQQSCKLEHVVWHNGGTEGYRAAAFMLPRRGVGVVALTNSSVSVDSTAFKALELLVDDAKLGVRKVRPSPRLEEAMAAAAALVEKGNINEPDYLALFAPSFRKQVPLGKLRQITQQLRSQHGDCRRQKWVELTHPGAGRARVRCDVDTEFDLVVELDEGTPPLVTGFVLTAPQPPAKPDDRCR